MQTLVVTGAAGFIGSNFVRLALARTDAMIVAVDNLTYAGHLESLADVADDPRFTFIKADISRRPAVEAIYREHRPSWVLNLAAESHVDRSIDGPRPFLETNVMGTFELLEAARRFVAELDRAARPAFRFVQVSTDEVYGSLGSSGLFSETTPYDPRSPYAASKAAADHLVRSYQVTYGLPAIITNCSNNYGPYQFPEKLVPLTVLNALEGRPLPIYGDGRQVRDWIHVEDHCEGILTVLLQGTPGEKYNIGAECERTNVEVVDCICSTLEQLFPAARNPALSQRGVTSYHALKTFVADRPGHDRRYAIDAGRIRRELGWRPRYDFATGLANTLRWYVDHREWCDAVQGGRYDRERLGLSGARGV